MSDDCWRRLEAIEEQTCWEVKEPVHLHASGARIAQRRTWPLASLSTVTRCLEIYGHLLPRDLLIGIGRGLVSTASSRQRSTTWTPNMDACLLLGEFLFFYFDDLGPARYGTCNVNYSRLVVPLLSSNQTHSVPGRNPRQILHG